MRKNIISLHDYCETLHNGYFFDDAICDMRYHGNFNSDVLLLKNRVFEKPLVMGILNVTPDSFSEGGQFKSVDQVVEMGLQMIEEGADILDVGGESTGPGSQDVSVEEELKRVLPVVEALVTTLKEKKLEHIFISVDTYKADVAQRVLELGVDMINDVTAFRGDEAMVKTLSAWDVPVVLMYSKDNTPRTTRENIQYDDVVKTVKDFLKERVEFAAKNGISKNRLLLDPGMGAFVSGDPKYSLQLLSRLKELQELGLPLVVGPSRKGFIGQILNVPLNKRLEGTLACCAVAAMNGASILRVHDVQETRRTVDMVHAIMTS
jgi:dihydropteroate synthase